MVICGYMWVFAGHRYIKKLSVWLVCASSSGIDKFEFQGDICTILLKCVHIFIKCLI